MFRYLVAGCAALVLGASPVVATAQSSPAPAATATPSPSAAASPVDIARSRIDTMLRTGHADPAWFSATFLAEYPASKIDDIITS